MIADNYRYFLPNLAKLNRSQPSYSLIGEPIRSGELFQAKNQVPLVSNIKGSLIIDLANNTKDSDSTRLLRRFDRTKSIDVLYEPYSIFIEDEKYPEVFPLEERQERLEKRKISSRYEHFFLFNFLYTNFLQPLLTYDNLETNDGSSDLAIDYTSYYSPVEGVIRCFGEASVRQVLATRMFGRLLRPVFLQRKLRSRPQKKMLFGRYDVISARFFTNQRRLGNRFRLLTKHHQSQGSVYYWLAGFQHPYLAFNAKFSKLSVPVRLFALREAHAQRILFSDRLLNLLGKRARPSLGFRSMLLPTYRGSSWPNRARIMEFAFSVQRARTKFFATVFRLFLLALENIPQVYNKTRYGRLNRSFLHRLVQKLLQRTGIFLNLTSYFHAMFRLNSTRISRAHRSSTLLRQANGKTKSLVLHSLFRDRFFVETSASLLMSQASNYSRSNSLFETLLLPRLPALGYAKRNLEAIRLLGLKQNEDELADLEQDELENWDFMTNGKFLISEDFRVQKERSGQILRDFVPKEGPLYGFGIVQPTSTPTISFQVRLARLRALRHWPGGFASVLRHRRRFSRYALLLRSWSLLG